MSNKRIPRKKGQPAGSDKHSDLYTDENPKGTIHGLKFATVEDAKASVAKIKRSGRSHAHKIQAAIAMEQRARVMGKTGPAAVYRKFINAMKQKTKEKNESLEEKGKGLWYNIMMKRKRGERMRKKGEKGAPTQAQMDKARAASEEMTTAADAGIPHDTKTMGPRFTTTNVMDRRKKKRPALLKRFSRFIDDTE